jgi:hypothetical protein
MSKQRRSQGIAREGRLDVTESLKESKIITGRCCTLASKNSDWDRDLCVCGYPKGWRFNPVVVGGS